MPVSGSMEGLRFGWFRGDSADRGYVACVHHKSGKRNSCCTSESAWFHPHLTHRSHETSWSPTVARCVARFRLLQLGHRGARESDLTPEPFLRSLDITKKWLALWRGWRISEPPRRITGAFLILRGSWKGLFGCLVLKVHGFKADWRLADLL